MASETGTDPTGDPSLDSTTDDGMDDDTPETSSGPMLCDDLDACSTCRACSIESDCSDEHGACTSDEACAQLLECLQTCQREGQGDACEDSCFARNPSGQALVLALHQCLVTACPNSCG
jgi:hypothetical protein